MFASFRSLFLALYTWPVSTPGRFPCGGRRPADKPACHACSVGALLYMLAAKLLRAWPGAQEEYKHMLKERASGMYRCGVLGVGPRFELHKRAYTPSTPPADPCPPRPT